MPDAFNNIYFTVIIGAFALLILVIVAVFVVAAVVGLYRGLTGKVDNKRRK